MPPDVELLILDKRLHEWGLPRYQSEAAAAIDLHACIDATLTIRPGSVPVLVPAGFAIIWPIRIWQRCCCPAPAWDTSAAWCLATSSD